jgi:hypothetical protein
MFGAVNSRYGRVQEELVAAEIEVAPSPLAMIVLRALLVTLRASARPAPFKANIDPLAFTIELGLDDVPRILNPKKLLEKLGVAHGEELRRRWEFLSLAHSNSRRPT